LFRPDWIPASAWRVTLACLETVRATGRARAELLTAAALLAGWALITLGLAQLTTSKVWPLSAGILLLSLCGWRFLGVLFRDGLYRLTREDARKVRRG
jgi:hypothetical protein